MPAAVAHAGRPGDAADEHPVQPGPEAVLAELAQVAPCCDGASGTSSDARSGSASMSGQGWSRPIDAPPDAEGVPAASLCPLDQIPLHARNASGLLLRIGDAIPLSFHFWAGRWRRRPVERIDPTPSLQVGAAATMKRALAGTGGIRHEAVAKDRCGRVCPDDGRCRLGLVGSVVGRRSAGALIVRGVGHVHDY